MEGVSGTPISGRRLSRSPLYRFDLQPLLQDGVRRIAPRTQPMLDRRGEDFSRPSGRPYEAEKLGRVT